MSAAHDIEAQRARERTTYHEGAHAPPESVDDRLDKIFGPTPDSTAELEHYIDALERKLYDCNPCRSCGADPSFDPPTGQELPIVKSALDAQADAESRCADLQRRLAEAQQDAILWKGEAERHEAAHLDAVAELDTLRSGTHPIAIFSAADAAEAPRLRDELREANRRAGTAIEMGVLADKATRERNRLALQLNALGAELLELRQIEGRRRREINILKSRLDLELNESAGAARKIGELSAEVARLREHAPEVNDARLQAMTDQRDVAIDEIDRLRAVNNQLAKAQRGKLILAEVDVREPKRPRLIVLVAPEMPDERAAAMILQHLGPALGIDPRRVVTMPGRVPPHSQETAEEAAACGLHIHDPDREPAELGLDDGWRNGDAEVRHG